LKLALDPLQIFTILALNSAMSLYCLKLAPAGAAPLSFSLAAFGESLSNNLLSRRNFFA